VRATTRRTALWATAWLLVLVVVRQANVASAGINVWTSNGPGSGDITSLVIDPTLPTTVYGGARGGAFKSTDAGASWNAIHVFEFSDSVIVAIDPRPPAALYTGNGADVSKSTDGGASWSLSDSSTCSRRWRCAVAPLRPPFPRRAC
jgi:hypothetical protein